jgi:polyisoprenoid-binding protein YceI
MPLPIRRLAICCVFGLSAAATAAPNDYVIDPAHSSASFAIRHLLFKVRGTFSGIDGTIQLAPGSDDQDRAVARIEVGSLETGIDKRDSVLTSPDYFNAVKYPVMIFNGRSWRRTGNTTYEITGDLTIKNVTREVVLEAQEVKASNPRAVAFNASAELNRRDFGVVGPIILDEPISDKLEVSIHIEAYSQ